MIGMSDDEIQDYYIHKLGLDPQRPTWVSDDDTDFDRDEDGGGGGGGDDDDDDIEIIKPQVGDDEYAPTYSTIQPSFSLKRRRNWIRFP
jgi:hypothetical protein